MQFTRLALSGVLCWSGALPPRPREVSQQCPSRKHAGQRCARSRGSSGLAKFPLSRTCPSVAAVLLVARAAVFFFGWGLCPQTPVPCGLCPQTPANIINNAIELQRVSCGGIVVVHRSCVQSRHVSHAKTMYPPVQFTLLRTVRHSIWERALFACSTVIFATAGFSAGGVLPRFLA